MKLSKAQTASAHKRLEGTRLSPVLMTTSNVLVNQLPPRGLFLSTVARGSDRNTECNGRDLQLGGFHRPFVVTTRVLVVRLKTIVIDHEVVGGFDLNYQCRFGAGRIGDGGQSRRLDICSGSGERV